MTPVLEVRGGAVGYGSVSLVRNLDLAVEAGKFTCLLGPNGAGKTTLLRALAGLGALLSGDVLLDGKLLRRCSRASVSTRIAVVLTESLAIPGMTVGELVRLGRHPFTDWKGSLSDADLSSVRKALAVMDLSGWEDRALQELSDGERQRAAIARALAQESDVLLLDEPTTYLDLTHRAEVLRILRDVAWTEGRAVVAALHDLDLALRYADRVWLFDPKADPSRVIVGGPEDLLFSGAVERVFSSRSVRYDPLEGTFEMRDGAPLPVHIEKGTDDRLFRMALRTVSRVGGVPADRRESRISLACPASGGAWVLEGPGGTESFHSLEEVAASLRKNFVLMRRDESR